MFDPRPIANNGLIVSGDDGLRLYCVSNSSQSGVGTITTSNGDMFNIGSNGIWNVAYPGNRPGFLRLQTRTQPTTMLLTASDQGIYTCTIPDDEGNDIILNVGLYPNDFNGKYNLYTPDISLTLSFLLLQCLPPSWTWSMMKRVVV